MNELQKMTRWRRVMAQRIRRLTPEQAEECLLRIRAKGITIDQPVIRELTGGYASQSVNAIVMRRLAARAGRIPKHAG